MSELNLKLNPFAEARIKSKKTKVQISDLMRVSPQYIARLELGLFPTVPIRLREIYIEEFNLHRDWEKRYNKFRLSVRRNAPTPALNQIRLGQLKLDPQGAPEFKPIETFTEFRQLNWPTMSQINWCHRFAVHPASIYAIENSTQQRFPNDLRCALIESRLMSPKEVHELAELIKRGRIQNG